jgi:hypothetical protein
MYNGFCYWTLPGTNLKLHFHNVFSKWVIATGFSSLVGGFFIRTTGLLGEYAPNFPYTGYPEIQLKDPW